MDIRKFFSPVGSSKTNSSPDCSQNKNRGTTKRKLAVEENRKGKQKKKIAIIDSDSDEDPLPVSSKKGKKKLATIVDDEDFCSTTKQSVAFKTHHRPKSSGEPLAGPKLKATTAAEFFGTAAIQRKKNEQKVCKKRKNSSEDQELHSDPEFEATLSQLDEVEPAIKKAKKAAKSPREKNEDAMQDPVRSPVKNSPLKHTDNLQLSPVNKPLSLSSKLSNKIKEQQMSHVQKDYKKEQKSKSEKEHKKGNEELERGEKREVVTEKLKPVNTSQKDVKSKETMKNDKTPEKQKTPSKVSGTKKKIVTPVKTPSDVKVEDETTSVDPSEKKRFNAMAYRKYLQREGPKNPGSKEVPEGQDACLTGLVFVITGVLDSLMREEAADLVKKYGGKVTMSVSRNTSYLVVGDDPGQSKLNKAEKCGTKIISEDELLELIRTRPGVGTNKKPKEKSRMKENSISRTSDEKKGKEKIVLAETESSGKSMKEVCRTPSPKKNLNVKKKIEIVSPLSNKSSPELSQQSTQSLTGPELTQTGESVMWVDKYKPTSTKQIIGQQGDRSNMRKLVKWLLNWNKNQMGGKKLPRPSPWAKNDDGAFFKAALLSGPPGVGKTTTTYLVCKELGFDIVEMNASDTRSKRLLQGEVSELLSSKSLSGFFHSETETEPSSKHVLVMDEVDGMAGNEDRGGVQELIHLIKGSKIPVICMCNDRNHQKIRSLANYCFDLRFQKPRLEQIKGAIMSICFKEGLKIKPEALNDIILGTNQDIRQILHHLSVWSAKEKSLSQEQAKTEALKAKKDLKIGPWDVVRKVFSAEEHKNMTIYNKSDLFFQDYSLGPLFVQENYLNAVPHAARGDRKKMLDLISKTADSLCDADLVEKTIRSQQSWTLLPVEAVYASVIPGELMEGYISAQITFPSWFGKNSKRGKFDRLLQELQMHMRLRISGSKNEVNMDYLSCIRDAISRPLIHSGADGVPDSVKVLQQYCLLREDLDGLMEVTVWPEQKDPMSQVEGKVKAAFTRAYNKEGIMTPYSAGMSVSSKKRKGGSNSQEEDLLGEEGDEGILEDEEDDDDITADSMIKAKKAAGKGGGGGRGGPAKREESDKGKAKGKGKGKGKGKRLGVS